MRLPKAFLIEHKIIDVVVRRKLRLGSKDYPYVVKRAIITYSSGEIITFDVDKELLDLNWRHWYPGFFKYELMRYIKGVDHAKVSEGRNSKGL